MSIYINGTIALFAKEQSKRLTEMLGESKTFPYFDAFSQPLLSLSSLYQKLDAHLSALLQKISWNADELSEIPILLGSTGYVISDCEYRLQHNQALPKQYDLSVIAQELQKRYQCPVFSFATSCTSSAQAIIYAHKLIKNELYKKAIVIGFESFNRLTMEHFQAMNLLQVSGQYIPLQQSNGIVLGEGIGIIALSNQPDDSCYEIFGAVTHTDYHNLTNSNENAVQTLLDKCLTTAHLKANQITAVKVHGVGGQADAMELDILQKYFPEARKFIIKSQTGHTLGAAGALETALLLNQPLPDGYILNYFLGFGGANVAWIMQKSKSNDI